MQVVQEETPLSQALLIIYSSLLALAPYSHWVHPATSLLQEVSLTLHCFSHPQGQAIFEHSLSISGICIPPSSTRPTCPAAVPPQVPTFPALGDGTANRASGLPLTSPKALTPLLLELHSENINQPTSFFCFQSFTCSSLPSDNIKIIDNIVYHAL